MNEFKSWEEMSVLEQYACQFWDMYKDAYGVRPRGVDTSAWDEATFEAEFNYLQDLIAKNDQEREIAEREATQAFEQRMQDLYSCGAKDRDMALRWVHEAEGSDGDDEFLCYLVGLPYGYFRRVPVDPRAFAEQSADADAIHYGVA
jgi:hypothetical protein